VQAGMDAAEAEIHLRKINVLSEFERHIHPFLLWSFLNE
jgi:hypothetical protein